MAKILISFILFFTLFNCEKPVKTIKFEKIFFHTSMCMGNCPVYHLEVDSNKAVRLFSEMVFKDGHTWGSLDSSKMGYFTGFVNVTSFERIRSALQSANIDTLTFDGQTCCDGSTITIIVYYNGKRKFLQSMFPPAEAQELISVLYETCDSNKLERTTEKFNLER